MSHFEMSHGVLSDDYIQLVNVLCTISERYFYAARLKDAASVLEHGEQLIGDTHKVRLAQILIQHGKIRIWTSLMGDNCLEEASLSLNRAIELADAANDKRLQAYAKLHLGHCLDFQKVLMDQGEWNDALELLRQSHELFLQTSDKAGQGTAVFFIGLIHQRLSQKAEAVQHFEQALDLAKQNENKFEEAEAIRHLGFFTFMDGKLDETFEHAKESLRLLAEIDCKIALSSANHAVGMIQEAKDNRVEAFAAYTRAVDLADELSLKVPLVQGLLGLSTICEKDEQMESAVEHAERAREIAQKTGYSVFINAASNRLEKLL